MQLFSLVTRNVKKCMFLCMCSFCMKNSKMWLTPQYYRVIVIGVMSFTESRINGSVCELIKQYSLKKYFKFLENH